MLASSKSETNRHIPWLPARWWVLLALLIVTVGCDRGAELPDDHKLVVIGFDGADWGLIDPLVAAGRMPVMKQFIEQSASGTNMSFVPLAESPVIWASMASGLQPGDHGIDGFIPKARGTQFSGQHLQVPAFWDLAGKMGMTSCIIGWWHTYPAHAINGVMVSDVYTYTKHGCRDEAGLVRPDSLRDDLAALEIDYRDITMEELGRFIDLESLAGHEDEMARDLRELQIIIAGDRTYLEMVKYLAARSDFDVFSVYFRGLDVACHKFWGHYQPEMNNRKPDSTSIAVFNRVIPNYYEYCDEILGEVLALFPDDRSVMVLSDHGFKGKANIDGVWVGGVQAHRPEGVYAVRSPIHEPGLRFDSTAIINVGPTILALMGLPASDEMPGVVINEGLTPAGLRYVEQLEGNRVESYQVFAPVYDDSIQVEDDAEMDEAVIRQLRSLGYID